MNRPAISRAVIILMSLTLIAAAQARGPAFAHRNVRTDRQPVDDSSVKVSQIDASEGGNLLTPQRQDNLGKYVGLYPDDLFKGEPGLTRRLRTFLGRNYSMFKGRLQTQMPIEDYDSALVLRGCMAHACGFEEAILVIGVDGKLHVAIKSEKFGGKFRIFSQDRAHVPEALNRAIREP